VHGVVELLEELLVFFLTAFGGENPMDTLPA
jgi:hypothetical protein